MHILIHMSIVYIIYNSVVLWFNKIVTIPYIVSKYIYKYNNIDSHKIQHMYINI